VKKCIICEKPLPPIKRTLCGDQKCKGLRSAELELNYKGTRKKLRSEKFSQSMQKCQLEGCDNNYMQIRRNMKYCCQDHQQEYNKRMYTARRKSGKTQQPKQAKEVYKRTCEYEYCNVEFETTNRLKLYNTHKCRKLESYRKIVKNPKKPKESEVSKVNGTVLKSAPKKLTKLEKEMKQLEKEFSSTGTPRAETPKKDEITPKQRNMIDEHIAKHSVKTA